MKKLYVGAILTLTLLCAQTAAAQNPCGGVCQAYYPCDYACDLCVGDPGLWEDGGSCWGEIVSGTCGDIGQCGWVPPTTCEPDWIYDEVSHQGVKPELTWDPPCAWQGSEYVCDYSRPYRCTIYSVTKYVRHQENCQQLQSSQTFCSTGWQRSVGHYAYPWDDWACCSDAGEWNCTTSFPACPYI